MKYWLVLICVIILSLVIHSALSADLACNMKQGSCNPTETKILGFYNQSYNFSNAHTQLANYTNYPSVLCCNSTKYQIGNSSGEVVAKLSTPTNAHISYNSYIYPIYLSQNQSKPLCRLNTTCSPIYTCLLSMSNITNAHLGGCSDPYTWEICCKTRDLVTLNITTNASSGTFPINFNITASSSSTGDSDITYTLWRNNQLITNPDIVTLAVGSYTYVYNITSDGENYTYSQSNLSFSINKFNTSSVLYMSNIINFTGTYPVNSSTQGFGCPSQLTCTLYYDGITAPNPYYNLIGVGNHTFTYSTPGNENYTAASLTWYVGNINTSMTTIITVAGSTGGGGGIYVVSPDCTYLFDKPFYYIEDNLTLSFRCANYFGYYSYTISDDKGNILQTALSHLTGPANITYHIPKSMVGIISVKSITSTLFNATFRVVSTPIESLLSTIGLPISLKSGVGYIYIIGLGAILLFGLYILNTVILFEEKKKKQLQKKEQIIASISGVCVIGIGVLLLYLQGWIGYVVISLIGLLLLGILYFLNKLITEESLTKNEKSLLIGLAIVIAGIIIYSLAVTNMGYIYIGIVLLIVLVLIFLLNKIITKEESKWKSQTG